MGKIFSWFKNKIPAETFLLASLLIGFTLRISLLLRPEQYWFDEVLSLYISRYSESIPSLIKFLQVGDYHPPLYYLLMFYWTRAFGIGEVAVRSLSLIFGLLSLPLFYLFSRKLFSQKVSVLALFLLAINPLHIEYSIEARPYTMFAFFGLAAAYLFVLLINKRRWYLWLLFILVNQLGIYTHYSYFHIVAAFAAYQIYTFLNPQIDRKYAFSLKEILFFVFLTFLGFLPWFSAFVGRYLESTNGIGFYKGVKNDFATEDHYKPLYLEDLLFSLLWLIKFPLGKWGLSMLFVGKLSLLSLLLLLVRHLKEKISWKHALLFFLIITPVIVFLLSPYFQQYSTITSRHLLPLVYPLCIFVSLSFWNLKPSILRLFLFLLFLVSLGVSLSQLIISDSLYNPFHRVKQVMTYIESKEKPGDLILINQHVVPIIFEHYYNGKNEITSYFPIKDSNKIIRLTRGSHNSIKAVTPTNLLNEGNYHDLAGLVERKERVWLIQQVSNPYFVRYFSESGWALKDFAPLNHTFQVLLFEKAKF